MAHQKSDKQLEAGDDILLPVGLDQPGFFPFARFPLSVANYSRPQPRPLSANPESAIWPASTETKTPKTATSAPRKKPKESF